MGRGRRPKPPWEAESKPDPQVVGERPHVCTECGKTYKLKGDLNNHIRAKHTGTTFECEFYGRSFNRKPALRVHLKKIHNYTRPRMPCTEGCDEDFVDEEALEAHLRKTHKVKNLACPEPGCEESFHQRYDLRNHIQLNHKGQRHQCPHDGCDASYTQASGLYSHFRTIHQGKVFECPLKEDTKCDRTFNSSTTATIHAESVHGGMRDDCPLKQELGCLKLFTTKSNATAHGRQHEYRQQCTVPMCVRAISKQPLHPQTMSRHMEVHEKKGQLQGLKAYPQANDVRLGFKEILSREGRNPGTIADAEDAEDTEDVEDGQAVMEVDSAATLVHLTNPGIVDKEARTKYIQDRNNRLRSEWPTASHTNFGNTCIGPGPIVDGMVSQPCPHNNEINYTTAQLRVARNVSKLTLSGRCVSCDAENTFYLLLKSHGIGAQDGQVVCARCDKPIWHGTTFCYEHFEHFDPWAEGNESELVTRMAEIVAEATANVIWKPTTNGTQRAMNRRADIESGRCSPCQLVHFDSERNLSTGRVHEVAILDASGRTVVDTFTDLSDKGMERTSRKPGQSLDCFQKIGARAEAIVRRRAHGKSSMTAEDLSTTMIQNGITPETMFVVWATNKSDLGTLRGWFKSEGIVGVLPDHDNCILPLYDFRANLKQQGAAGLCLKLPILFPAFFGTDHPACGNNHTALMDTRRLWLLFEAFVQLCLPPERRLSWRS